MMMLRLSALVLVGLAQEAGGLRSISATSPGTTNLTMEEPIAVSKVEDKDNASNFALDDISEEHEPGEDENLDSLIDLTGARRRCCRHRRRRYGKCSMGGGRHRRRRQCDCNSVGVGEPGSKFVVTIDIQRTSNVVSGELEIHECQGEQFNRTVSSSMSQTLSVSVGVAAAGASLEISTESGRESSIVESRSWQTKRCSTHIFKLDPGRTGGVCIWRPMFSALDGCGTSKVMWAGAYTDNLIADCPKANQKFVMTN